MKRFLFLLILSITSHANAGDFHWPNVEYDHAKLYLFNVTLDKPQNFNWNIYENGAYSAYKVGNGYMLTEEFLDELHSTMVRGVDELRLGLGKCYIPRHGIVYYDKKGNAVASLSICFECNQISFWSKRKLHPVNEKKATLYDKAEKQIADMKAVINKYSYPIYKNKKEYLEYLKSNSSLLSQGEIFISNNHLDSLFAKKYTISKVKSWTIRVRRSHDLKESIETKITTGGQKYSYRQLKSTNSSFIFNSEKEDAHLIEATIRDFNIKLPTGVSVGMSSDDVIATLGVYDGIANPEFIRLEGKQLTIDYFFKYQTLIKIKLSFTLS